MLQECLCSGRVSVVEIDTAEQIMLVAEIVLGSAVHLYTIFLYTGAHIHTHKQTCIHVY